jgi:predicted nucleotidyltransferase component of viral defense system
MNKISDNNLIQNEMEKTGLPESRVLFLVARSALVRYLATEFADRFWLKGGALLYHVYDSPRVSFVDTDFADISKHKVNELELENIFTIEGDGFLIAADHGQWTTEGEIIKAKVPFYLNNFRTTRGKDSKIKISVSVRQAEILDKGEKLIYNAKGLLYGANTFLVNGLTLEELAAEKTLAWCLKVDLFKHYSDLALIARDFSVGFDIEKYKKMLISKFEAEKEMPETKGLYRSLRLNSPDDLFDCFSLSTKIASARKSWDFALDQQLWFTKAEKLRETSLTDF